MSIPRDWPVMKLDILRGIGVGDVVVLLYLAAFARQYVWPVAHGPAAWALTVIVAAIVWHRHLTTRDETARASRAFWIVVVPPLVAFYALRAAVPDMGWDVLDYRLVNAERALRGWPTLEGDFFPSRFPFNPAPDMALGLGRHLLGYRLGTVVNLLVLVWAGTILDRLLRPFVAGAWLRATGVLLLLLTEQVLFEINNYMVDLLALPLLLEATRLVLAEHAGASARRRALIRAGLYLGASVAFKLSNVAFAVPLFLLGVHRLARDEGRWSWPAVGYALAAVALPLAPYTLYVYGQTGNPVFPLYNDLFRSPYWPAPDPRTERWGPVVDDLRLKHRAAWEIVLWPLLLPFRVEHTAGDLGPHWGRVSLAFAAAAAGAVWRGGAGPLRQLSLVTLGGALLWAAGSGMLRYATYVEVAGGLVLVCLIARLWQGARTWAVGLVLALALVVQAASACVYAYRFEFGGRPAFFEDPRGHLREARHVLRDYTPARFLPETERKLFETVDVWAQSGPLTGGYQLLLRPAAPQWCLYMPEFFATEVARAGFARAAEAARGKRVYTLVLTEHFAESIANVRAAGLGVGRVIPLALPFYSSHGHFHEASLVEVLPRGQPTREIRVTAVTGPLAADAFRAALRWAEPPPARVRGGDRLTLRVVVRNLSAASWPARGAADDRFRLFVGNHWLDPSGRIVVNDDARAPLPFDVAPGEEQEIAVDANAPRAAGDYVLEIDLLQESVAWFSARGSPTLRWTMVVEP